MTDDKLRERLLACPFCAGDDIREECDEYGDWRIICHACSASMPAAQKADAIDWWNTRAELTRNTAIVDQLAEALQEAMCFVPASQKTALAKFDQALATYRESVKC